MRDLPSLRKTSSFILLFNHKKAPGWADPKDLFRNHSGLVMRGSIISPLMSADAIIILLVALLAAGALLAARAGIRSIQRARKVVFYRTRRSYMLAGWQWLARGADPIVVDRGPRLCLVGNSRINLSPLLPHNQWFLPRRAPFLLPSR